MGPSPRGFTHISRSPFNGWIYTQFQLNDGTERMIRFNALTKDDVLLLFQRHYLNYTSTYNHSNLTREMICFWPETWLSFADCPMQNASITFSDDDPLDYTYYHKLDNLTEVSGTTRIISQSLGGIYSDYGLNCTGDQGDRVRIGFSHPATVMNHDNMVSLF